MNLGFALFKNKRYADALHHYDLSKDSAQKKGNAVLVYNILGNIAETLGEMGELEQAIEILNDNLTAFERLGMQQELSSCKIELCLLHAKLAENYKNSAMGENMSSFAEKQLETELPEIVKNLSS